MAKEKPADKSSKPAKSKTAARRDAGAASAVPSRSKTDPHFLKNLEQALQAELLKAGHADPKRIEALSQAPAGDRGMAAGRTRKIVPEQVPGNAVQDARVVGKTVNRKSAKKASELASEALRQELAELLPQLDQEGLVFLLEQARVHLYNMKVLELEAAAEQLAARRPATAQAARQVKSGKGRTKTVHDSAAGTAGTFRIEAAAGGSVYHLVSDEHWKMFAGDEMLAMVKICSSADAPELLAARLHRWLKAERSDFFADIAISGAADPKMIELVQLLRKTFTIKR